MFDKQQIGKLAQITGVIIAVASSAAFAAGLIDVNLWVTILGFGGFAGLNGLRTEISSSGFKTYILGGGFAVVGLGVAFGLVSPVNAAVVFSVLGVGAMPTLSHAVKKASLKK